MKKEEVRTVVRNEYAKAATRPRSCCCGQETTAMRAAKRMGYSKEELAAIPSESVLGLGCGNPTALASLQLGERVLDLGAGAGIDCFLAANAVGENGRVIGVDMTPEMIDRARANVRKAGYGHVEFRLGEIENLPVADGSVDVVISNCVINLSPDKPRVFAEAFRALRPGGRMMVSDIVLLKDLPEAIRTSPEAYAGCISGAEKKAAYLGMISEAGFTGIEILSETPAGVHNEERVCCDGERRVKSGEEALGEIEVVEKKGIAPQDVFAVSISYRAVKPE